MAKTTLVNKNLSAPEVGALITEGKWSVRGARAMVEITKKTRGKPIKQIYHVALPMLSVDLEVEEQDAFEQESAPKKRGRKPKVVADTDVATSEVPAAPKKRGRKPKVTAEVAEGVVVASKKRGRKPKVQVEGEPAAPKKRGRKPKVVVEPDAPTAAPTVAEEPAAPKKRGRKPRVTVAEVTPEAPEATKAPAPKEQSSSSPWNTTPSDNEYEF